MSDSVSGRRKRGTNQPLPEDFDELTAQLKSERDSVEKSLGGDFWKMTGPQLDAALSARRKIEVLEGRLANRSNTSKRVRGR